MRLNNGPPPTPTPVLKARGSWRAKKREGEPKFTDGVGPAPSFLSKEGKAEWQRVAKLLTGSGLAQRVDRAALAVYCEAWGEFVDLVDALAARAFEEGMQRRSAVAEKNAAAQRVLATADRFGFSPAARARVKAPERQPAADGEGKARFFRTTG